VTVKLSPHKVAKIIRLYFSGLAQMKIAKKAGVDQSCVSIYATRFKERVSEIGLLAAGKEFTVFDEVSALRSLSMELSKAKLTVDEAKEGLRIMRIFMKLGISSGKHAALVKVCKEVDNPDFIHAALKLSKIEDESHKSYEEAIAEFEEVTSVLPTLKKQVESTKAELNAVNESVGKRKQELASLEAQLTQLQKEAQATISKLKKDFADNMKQLSVKQAEVEQVARLKADLYKSGLDIPTLVKLAKEFDYGKGKS